MLWLILAYNRLSPMKLEKHYNCCIVWGQPTEEETERRRKKKAKKNREREQILYMLTCELVCSVVKPLSVELCDLCFSLLCVTGISVL